jgi:hypothetical protein
LGDIKTSATESLGYCEPKKHKPWLDEECSKLLDQRKQARFQWLKDPSEKNGDNLNNIRLETSTHFSPKRDEVTGGWRKLHNEELHNLYSSASTVGMIKPRWVRWAGHVARMWPKRNA